MLDALSRDPGLIELRTRDDADFSIALLDAWAIVCDILTFYDERIANESYLRTGTERLSVGELAKLIGYKLRPGLAAATAVAFTIDAPVALPPAPSAPPTGAPRHVTLDSGVKVQSIPDPGQQPATFETVSAIAARAEWNAISPRQRFTRSSAAASASANVRLQAQPAVRPGDLLLLVAADAPSAPNIQRAISVEPDNATQTTLVHFEDDLDEQQAALPSAVPMAIPAQLDDAFVWSAIKGRAWADQARIVAFAEEQGWSLDAVQDQVNALRQTAAPLAAFAVGVKASLFGNNAPLWDTIPTVFQGDFGPFPTTWEGLTLQSQHDPNTPHVDLDNVYPAVGAGSWVVLRDGTTTKAFRALAVQELSRTDFLLTATITRVFLDCAWGDIDSFVVRTTRVLAQTDGLPVAEVLSEEEVAGSEVMLDGAFLSLRVGQLVALTGVRTDKRGETESEVMTIASLRLVDGYTVLGFAPELRGRYARASVTIDANVAQATHGETRSELLGTGDASQAFQRFALKQTPLTYVSAPNASGSSSTLQVRVNGVLWTEVPWLYGSGPQDRVYTVVVGADGRTYVQFGDGASGARPPSGSSNIQATYRQGIGSGGLVRAGQLSTLLSRPLGLKGASNPLPSTGAADAETLDDARRNAPVTVRTLDRIVTLEDFEDFARATGGIAKAGVAWVWSGTRDVACVTVAGIGGSPVAPGTLAHTNLIEAMKAASDGTVPVVLCDRVPVTFSVAATILCDPALLPSSVLDAVRKALTRAFGFTARAFSQPVYRSEVITVIQEVPGVIELTLDAFGYCGSGTTGPLPDVLVAKASTTGPGGIIGAQLLTLDPGRLPDLRAAPGPAPAPGIAVVPV